MDKAGQNSFYSKKAERTPEIDFNRFSGELLLEGRSIPSNAGLVYGDALEWINEYAKNPNITTNLRLNLDYFNTASTFWIAKIIRTLSSMKFPDRTLFIHMYVDVDEMENLGDKEIKGLIDPVVNLDEDHVINLCIKLYGKGIDGEILKEIDVFL